MIFIMHSKTFQNEFLVNESDDAILDTNYIIVSSKIRKRTDRKNIISAYGLLFPENSVMMEMEEESMEEAYFDQLDKNGKGFLASIILGAIEKNFNIVFLCTKTEYTIPYLKWIQDYVLLEFHYPIYEYKSYTNGCDLLAYDREKVVKKCKKTLKKISKKQFEEDKKTVGGREKIHQQFKKMSKKELKKELKKQNLYSKEMSKEEMVEMLELFM